MGFPLGYPETAFQALKAVGIGHWIVIWMNFVRWGWVVRIWIGMVRCRSRVASAGADFALRYPWDALSALDGKKLVRGEFRLRKHCKAGWWASLASLALSLPYK